MNSPFYLTPIPFIENLKNTLSRNDSAKRKLQNIFTGKTVIDIGCGIEQDAKDIQEVCIDFHAKKYIGIDMQTQNEHENFINETKVELIKKDILEYLKGADISNHQKVFVFFGFEPVKPEEEDTQKYIKDLMGQISQKSRINDIILIGNGTHGINPANFNFIETEKIIFENFNIRQYVKQT